ncbi:MAG: hypothetical protein WD011_04865 [Nitriliruptoraceae bacterium]
MLLDVLTKAGLSPKARRTRRGIVVTVDDQQADQAHRTLVENMDAIARAAHSAPRAARPARSSSTESSARRLPSQRMQAWARPLGVLLIGLVVSSLIPPLRIPVLVFTVAAMIYVIGKQDPPSS